jgi:hypothetical protein
MATVTLSSIVNQARLILQDQDAVRWSDSEFLGWIVSAYREIIWHKPEANSISAEFTTVADTHQTLPDDGAYLIDVIRTWTGTESTATNKRAVKLIDRIVLDSQNPDWHNRDLTTGGGSGVPKYFVYDLNAPLDFYLYPAPTASTKIRIQYARIPTAPTALTDKLALNDTYAGVVLDYLLYRAYSKDATVGDATLAQNYANMFYQQIGLKRGGAQQPQPLT